MRPLQPPDGKCPRENRAEPCNLVCKYNLFEADELVIHSWELKCLDCGFRQTVACRNDEEDEEPVIAPGECPFCHRNDLVPGANPCQANAGQPDAGA